MATFTGVAVAMLLTATSQGANPPVQVQKFTITSTVSQADANKKALAKCEAAYPGPRLDVLSQVTNPTLETAYVPLLITAGVPKAPVDWYTPNANVAAARLVSTYTRHFCLNPLL